MKKLDLAQSLFNNDSLRLSKQEAKESVNVIIHELTSAIVSGKGVEIRGFGGFHKKYRKPRVGVNPQTGELTQVREKFVPFFKAGKPLKDLLNKP